MIYKVSEIATLLGVTRASIYSFGKRGYLLIENGKIDDAKQVNAEYLTRRIKKKAQEESDAQGPEEEEEGRANTGVSVSIHAKLSIMKMAKLKEDTKFAKLRNEKLEGSLIATDIVGMATGEVILRYKSTMVQKIDQLLRDFCNENLISNEIRTKTLSKLVDIANEASQRTIQETKFTIEKIISEGI
jgi:predicted transcriptional regulator